MDDAELIQRFAETRSNEVFTELVRRHLPLVYGAALRRLGGDSHRAEDVAQCVFAELARGASGLSRHPSLEGWLYTTTRNVALQAVRAEHRRARREHEALMNADRHEPAPEIDAAQLRPVIDGALDRLNARDRELVLMRFFLDHAFGEIGKRLGISEDAARFRLNRALDRLRAELQKVGITSTPAALALVVSEQAHAAGTDAMVHAVATGALAKASAGSAGGALVHLLHLMSSTKAAVTVGVLIACIGGIWVHRDYAALRTARAELTTKSRAYAKLSEPLKIDREPAAGTVAATGATVALTSAVAVSRLSPVTAQTTESASKAAVAAKVNPDDQVNWTLSRDPAVRAALTGWMKGVLRSHASFYRAAKLTPQQIEQVENLSLEYNTNMGSAVLTLRPQGKSIAQVDAEMRAALGEAGSEQAAQYAKVRFVEAVTIGLAGFVYDTDTPLTSPQAAQLTQILFESSAVGKTGVPPFPKDIDWNLVLPRAQNLLTPSQYNALKEVAVVVKYAPAGLNPAFPNTYGDGLNPPPFVYSMGGP